MLRSTRIRRGVLESLAISSRGGRDEGRALGGAATSAAPLVKVRATEEQLAARRILIEGNRSLSRKLPQGVPMQPEICRRGARIEPLSLRLPIRVDTRRESVRHALRDLLDE